MADAADRRVDPTVGISASALRLLLLGLVTVAASAYAWAYVHQVLTMDTARSRLQWCSPASPTDPSPPYRTEQARCWAETMAHPLALTIMLGVLITAAASALIFAVAPRVRVAAGRLRPAPHARDRLSELAVAVWWALALTVVLPYGAAALASGYALSAAVPLLTFVAIAVLARLWCRALLRSREAELRPRSRSDVRRTSLLDLATLAATTSFVVPIFSSWLQQLSYGMSFSPVVAQVAAWLGGAGLGVGLWALSWRQAVARWVTGQPDRPGRPLVWGAVATTVGFSAGVFLTPLPREGGGLVDQHPAEQWVSIAVVSVASAMLILSLARALAERLVARALGPRIGPLLNGAGVVATALAAALVVEGVRTFVMLAQPGTRLTEVVLLAAVRFVIMPATWVVAVAAAAAGILALRQPPVPATERSEWLRAAVHEPTKAHASGSDRSS